MWCKQIKSWWWAYYLTAGGVFADYEFATNQQTETVFGTALNVVGWPFYLINNVETSLGRQL